MAEVSELLVLHTVRLTGVVPVGVVAGRLDADRVVVEAVLDDLSRQGLVRHRAGTMPGWSLTPAGRARGESLLAAELDRVGARTEVEGAYAEFLDLNAGVLRACSDWQVLASREGLVLNTHDDPAHDAEVLDRLAGLHGRAVGVLAAIEAHLGRFTPYRPRLDNALARARGGALEWVTKPLIDSYHTVWFELHEDLLATLGRRRADERDNGAPGPGTAGPKET